MLNASSLEDQNVKTRVSAHPGGSWTWQLAAPGWRSSDGEGWGQVARGHEGGWDGRGRAESRAGGSSLGALPCGAQSTGEQPAGRNRRLASQTGTDGRVTVQHPERGLFPRMNVICASSVSCRSWGVLALCDSTLGQTVSQMARWKWTSHLVHTCLQLNKQIAFS